MPSILLLAAQKGKAAGVTIDVCSFSSMYQDSRYNYELPSIYKAGPVEERESFDIQPSATQNQGLIDHDLQGYPSPPSSADNPSNVNDRHLAWLLLMTPLAMLIFTVIPAVASFPYVDTMTTGDAIFRLIDPVSSIGHIHTHAALYCGH